MKPPRPDERAAVLDHARALKMARSAHAYVRGNTVQFYEWLMASPVALRVPVGPAIWICGDCHLGNLGPLADGEGSAAVQIRDLDQAVIGNPAHDLIRLGLSLATAARGSDLPGVTTAHMIEQMVDGYEQALVAPDGEQDRPEPDVVRAVRRRALGRRWRHLAEERIDDVEPILPLGKKFWPLARDERAGLERLIADEAVASTILSFRGGDADRPIRLVDAAYWMKGCSSLGLLRYAVLVAIDDARHHAGYALVDVKQASAPAAPVARGARMPADPAQRVLAGACALSPHLGDRMAAARLGDASVFVRELAPQDLKLEVDQFGQSEAVRAARYLAWVVGQAHARQMDDATRRDWRRTLGDRHGRTIDAPLWLWEAIVDLAARHEAGYLEHCRRYALGEAA